LLPWLVITADRTDAGRGVRGYSLAWFLREYFGRGQVASQTPAEARTSPIAAETILLGLPTSLEPDEIRQLIERTGCRRLVPFDYLDKHEQAWTNEQRSAAGDRTQVYLKPWSEPHWNRELRSGHLPLRLRCRLAIAVTKDRLLHTLGLTPRRKYDVSFFGRPNRTTFYVNGQFEKREQRIDWLRQLRSEAPELSFYGGLTHCEHPKMRPENRDLCFHKNKIHFFNYWRAMRRSRVLLAPGGNVPWTYRHYECLYAGGVLATIDYRERDMLIPLPRELMVHVPDGAAVLPYVREALERSRANGNHAEQVYQHLDQYLQRGAYSRKRPALMERFLKQLD
jgi:hypothetical protein